MDIYGSTGVWYLIGAILVWFMQAGFAMVETGFTRAKNAGNIIMKNLMDFCLGTIVFVLLGAGLLMGEDALFGLVGIPTSASLRILPDMTGPPSSSTSCSAQRRQPSSRAPWQNAPSFSLIASIRW